MITKLEGNNAKPHLSPRKLGLETSRSMHNSITGTLKTESVLSALWELIADESQDITIIITNKTDQGSNLKVQISQPPPAFVNSNDKGRG